MTHSQALFPEEEYDARLERVKERMAARDLDAILVTTPENIYYLCGLDHQGFFAYHALLVPREGEMALIARNMERATVEAQVTRARFVGYPDTFDRARVTAETLRATGLAAARLGIEKDSLYFPPLTYENLLNASPKAHWVDVSGVINEIRLVKSPRELAYTRAAARVSEAMMEAALATARAGVNEIDVAAEVHRAMILAGGEYPGFGPFIRPTPRLNQEHTTWTNRELVAGEALFLELAGCVGRYHAPMGRFVHIGEPPPGARAIETVCREAFDDVVRAIRPGVKASEVYQAWQARVDRAGLSHYRRHHCGYLVGLAFPPSWTGGSAVVGLHQDNPMALQPGMVFHLLSWLVGTGRGDYFLSNAAALTETGCEVLTATRPGLQVG